jgi:threonine synthase
MNVGNPSNLARLVWLYGGIMAETGKIVRMPDMERMREDMDCASVTDKETREAIKDAYKKGIVLEPHGAVGWQAMQRLGRKKNLGKVALLETAHPAKFPEELDKLGVHYAIPESLARLDSLKENYVTINPSLEELKRIISA